MTNKVTARIRQATSDKGSDALWLFIDRVPNKKTTADDVKNILGLKGRMEDEESVAYAILKSELKAIREAIDNYLKNDK